MPDTRLIFLISVIVLLAACSSANRTSIFRTFSVDEAVSVSIDAHQRAIISSKKIDARGSRIIYCAEPSPDAFSSITSSLGLKVGKLDLSDEASASLTEALSATASNALSARTATIQLLRDGLYRACEAHAAGELRGVEYVGTLRQYQDMILALLSIELLTKINQVEQPSRRNEDGKGVEGIEDVVKQEDADGAVSANF